MIGRRANLQLGSVAGSGRAARAAALVVAGGASSPRPRGALVVLDARGAAPAPAPAPSAGDAPPDATELEADVGAWRELWGGALDALRREPTINNTEEAVVAQLGAVAFLHCPVRNLGERGVSTPPALRNAICSLPPILHFTHNNTYFIGACSMIKI